MSVEAAYREFAKKHHLDGYKPRKPARKKRRRYMSASVKAYRKRHRRAGGKGWYGQPVPHGMAARGIRTVQRPEFALNKKPRLVRAVDYTYSSGRMARQDYRALQRQAVKEGATPLPTAQRLGYNAKYVTPENVSFYATRTGRALKFVAKKAGEAKARADKKRAEQAYQKAQQKALEQKAARQQKLADETPKEQNEAVGGVAEIAKEVQEKEKPRGVLGMFRK